MTDTAEIAAAAENLATVAAAASEENAEAIETALEDAAEAEAEAATLAAEIAAAAVEGERGHRLEILERDYAKCQNDLQELRTMVESLKSPPPIAAIVSEPIPSPLPDPNPLPPLEPEPPIADPTKAPEPAELTKSAEAPKKQHRWI